MRQLRWPAKMRVAGDIYIHKLSNELMTTYYCQPTYKFCNISVIEIDVLKHLLLIL